MTPLIFRGAEQQGLFAEAGRGELSSRQLECQAAGSKSAVPEAARMCEMKYSHGEA